MIVEDEAVVRLLVVETLNDLGYKALETADSAAALRILQSPQRVDLLVSDIGLPGLNGRQLADAARVTRPGLKVLFVTGYAEDAAGNAFLEPGMEIVIKPFTMEALASKIREMIEDPRVSGEITRLTSKQSHHFNFVAGRRQPRIPAFWALAFRLLSEGPANSR